MAAHKTISLMQMKAIVHRAYGLPEVLTLENTAIPVPKDDEVLIKVKAASINSWDWDLLRGTPFLVRLDGGFSTPKRPILGADMAGKVVAAGKSVTLVEVGDEVMGDLSGDNWGCFAEYVCASEKSLVKKPPQMTWEQAAATPQAAVLALQGLRNKGYRIQMGQHVLINGAGGGVGTFAIQMAKALGAEVTAVDITSKLDFLKTLGADHVIDYAKEDFTKNEKRYDLVLDMVANRSPFDYRNALSSEGMFVIVGGTTSTILRTVLSGPFISMVYKKKMGLLLHRSNKKDLEEIISLFETKKVAPVIDRCYPLDEVTEAMRYFGTAQMKGKIVVKM